MLSLRGSLRVMAVVAAFGVAAGCGPGSGRAGDGGGGAAAGGGAGAVGRGGAGGTTSGGAGTGGTASGGGGAGGTASGGTGTGGTASGGTGAGGMAVRDCLPDCVSSRRAACERPPVDAGGACFVSTITTSSGAGQVDCYANGVQEIHTPADGGTLVTITTPDGHTVCYQVLVEGSGPQHYETPAGQEFAILTPAGGGLYNVTCGGTTVSVDINNPSCATQNGGSCTSGTCP